MSYSDPSILNGIGAVINPDNIRPGIDLKDLERQMINGGLIEKTVKDPCDRFQDELHESARKLGVDFGNVVPTPITSAVDNTPVDEYEDDDYGQDDSAFDQPEPVQSEPIVSANPTTSSFNRFSNIDRPKLGGDLQSRTQEQERRTHIDSVIGEETALSFEKEKLDDMKCTMLAEIDELMSTLEGDDIDLSRIPKVTMHSDFNEVELVLKMLRYKNDHARYCSFAEEAILFGTYALEELFDGKRTWFDRYTPDLTGWHNHVGVKIKRMRHDTGQVVSSVMQDYNIGPTARILFELVPNMVMYSKMRKQQHGQPGLFNDEDMAQANASIRSAMKN